MTDNPIAALVRFFVEAGASHIHPDFSDALAESLGVELGADADSIEVQLREKLKEKD
jgi:hypothetical protein